MRRSRSVFDGVPRAGPGSGTGRLLATLVAVAAAIVAIFFLGEYVQRYRAYAQARAGDDSLPAVRAIEPLRNIALNLRYAISRPLREAALLDAGLRVYDLEIAPRHGRTLRQTAEAVTAKTISTDIPRDYVPARFRYIDEWRPVQVKLRGLMSTHYLAARPSFRVKFPSERLFDGKKQINLSEPYDKGLIVDVATNAELERYGILTWDSRFVVLRLNGDVLGLYQEIEQFGRAIYDRNQRSEGAVLSGAGQYFGAGTLVDDKARAAIDAFAGCRGVETPAGAHCDWPFLRDYFDVDRWAWAAAMITLLHSSHAWHPDNLRVFWDPARGRFEPIPWDYNVYALDPTTAPDGEAAHQGHGHRLFALPEFRRLRDVRLWKLIRERVAPMLADADARFDALRRPLALDVRHTSLAVDETRHRAYTETVRRNAEILRGLFDRSALRVEIWRDEGGHTLRFENAAKAFAEIVGADVSGGDRPRAIEFAVPEIADGAWLEIPGVRVVRLDLAPGEQIVRLRAKNGVTGEVFVIEANALVAGAGDAPAAKPALQPPPALDIAGVRVDARSKTVTLGPGRVEWTDRTELPHGWALTLEAGLDLRMGEGAAIIAYGPLRSIGAPDRPIRVSPLAPGVRYGGIAVQSARTEPARVVMHHTIFRGGVGTENARTRFSAPFAVYGGRVELHDCGFIDGLAVDGINLKYAEVDLRNNRFVRTRDDALDCDFCTGLIADNRVVDAGGDGVDFSGSNVEVRDNTIAGCKDKGFSIGENTRAVLRGNRVEHCATGIAVKDRSEADIAGGLLEHVGIGISLYVKKPTFGPSRARVQGVEMRDVATPTAHDSACVLELVETP